MKVKDSDLADFVKAGQNKTKVGLKVIGNGTVQSGVVSQNKTKVGLKALLPLQRSLLPLVRIRLR